MSMQPKVIFPDHVAEQLREFAKRVRLLNDEDLARHYKRWLSLQRRLADIDDPSPGIEGLHAYVQEECDILACEYNRRQRTYDVHEIAERLPHERPFGTIN